MSYNSNKRPYLVIGIMLALLSGIMVFGLTQVARADERGFHHGEFLDGRHGHNHYYPARGHYVDVLPRGRSVFVHGGVRYYFYGGVWYRAYGPRFLIIAPPFGLVIPVLPPYYATIWVGGVPYYYANEVYYVQAPGGYTVVAPPEGAVSQAPPPPVAAPPSAAASPPGEQLFIYPRKGQSEKQQAEDRYQCHIWAVGQTKYDPTQPPGGMPSAQKDADYKRAMAACLDARGYTAK
ncbi:MAG TPA: DUF6515 family protein [Syntrophales bacterium]|nr:DUF6515 family protein [Syntrophales bacterium]